MIKWDIVVHYGLFFVKLATLWVVQHCATVVNMSTL